MSCLGNRYLFWLHNSLWVQIRYGGQARPKIDESNLKHCKHFLKFAKKKVWNSAMLRHKEKIKRLSICTCFYE